MFLPDFTVAIWLMSHRRHGYIVEIDSDLIDDGLPGGAFQSFQDLETHLESPQLLPEFLHRKLKVTAEQMHAIIALADQISYALSEHALTPMLGGSIYGLRLSRGFQEGTIVWRGRYEEQDGSIRKHFAAVQVLAEVEATVQTQN